LFTGSEKVQKAKIALLTMMRNPWEQGTAANAFIESGDDHIAILMAHEAVARQSGDGRLACMHNTFNITDPCVCGESVMFAYHKTGDENYLRAARKMLEYIDGAPGNADGIQFHNYNQPMIAADCMYMVPPFYAAMGRFDEATRQAEYRFRLLWNEEKGVMNHQWDAEKNILFRDKRWGSASGWNAAALVKLLKLLPGSMRDEKAKLSGCLRQLVSGVVKYQLENGLFYDNLDEDDTGSFVETNCAQMMAYSIYQGVKLGVLDECFIKAANNMRKGANTRLDDNGFVQGAAAAPDFCKPGISPEAQAFYILMETAADTC
jgi:rhamnogalacturonyl hydrolase YesR